MTQIITQLALALCALIGSQDQPEGRVIAQGRQPQAAVDADGAVWLTYARGTTIWLMSSRDGGQTFSQEQKVADVPALDLGMRRGPRIALTDGAVIVTAIAGQQGRGRDGDLLIWRSTDGGHTWSPPRALNSVKGSAREGLQATAAAGKHVAVVWLDLRGQATTLYGTFSSDGGATFSADRLLYTSPDGSVCECCAPQVAVDEAGRVAVMFRNALDGNRDMYLMKSSDGGASFSDARQQGEGHWLIHACPMDGGAVAFEDDDIVMVWRRESQLYVTRESLDDDSTDPTKEQPVGAGENAALAIGQMGASMAYTGEGGTVLYRDAAASDADQLGLKGEDPVIVFLPRQKAPLILWEAEKHICAYAPAPR